MSTIKELYDGSIVIHHISKHKDNPLGMENLRRTFEACLGATPLIHSERTSQYVYITKYYVQTSQYHMIRSMSHACI